MYTKDRMIFDLFDRKPFRLIQSSRWLGNIPATPRAAQYNAPLGTAAAQPVAHIESSAVLNL